MKFDFDNFDFDNIAEWAPRLSASLDALVPNRVRERVRTGRVEWLEEALDIIFEEVERSDLVEATRTWLRAQTMSPIIAPGSRPTRLPPSGPAG